MAGVSRLILHASIHFLRFEDVRTVRQSYVSPFADRVWIFTLKRQNIDQKKPPRARRSSGVYRFARSPLIAIYSATSGAG